MLYFGSTNKRLAPYPQEGKFVSCFHFVKRGILGIRMVHGFGPDWGDQEEDRSIGESLQRGSAQETLGEPSTFQLWHLGHNNH